MPFDNTVSFNTTEKMTVKPATFEFDGHAFVGVRMDSSLAGIFYLAKRGRQGDENALQVLVACQIVLKTADGTDYFNWRNIQLNNWNAAIVRMGQRVAMGISPVEMSVCKNLAMRYGDGERSVELYNLIVAAGLEA